MQKKGIKSSLKINENKYNIIIYGAGAYGKLTYDFLERYKNVNIVKWVDKNYNKIPPNEYPLPILNPEVIKNTKFDYIIITVKQSGLLKKFVSLLILMVEKMSKLF